MTFPPTPLTYSWTTTDAGTVRITLAGELDYSNVDEFLLVVTEHLQSTPALTALHLDCAGLTFCDSLGLSALLTIRRRTDAAGTDLHLDNRRPMLDRMLSITGTLDHLTGDDPRNGVVR